MAKPDLNEIAEQAKQVLEEVDAEAVERKERRLPRWMRERSTRTYLPEPERKARRERNQARARRCKARGGKRHGRPVGR